MLYINDLLKVIQVQRHDFLNHLQVIYGLVQLGKADRVKEYIEGSCRELQLMSSISRIKIPEIVAALLIGYNLAFEQQVDIEYRLTSELGETGMDGEVLGQVLLEIQKRVLHLAAAQAGNRQLKCIVEEKNEDYVCRFVLKEFTLSGSADYQKLKQVAENKSGLDNGRVEITTLEGGLEVALVFPRCDNNNRSYKSMNG